MEFAILCIVVYAVAIAIQTALLAGSLFLVEDVESGSFKELGVVHTLARCAAVTLVTSLLGLIPFGAWLALIVWFLGIMFLFQKSLGQTIVLLLVNGLVSIAVSGALDWFLTRSA